MSERDVLSQFLLALATLLSVLLARLRIPSMIGALFVGALAARTSLVSVLHGRESVELLEVLSQLGIEFLLFFVGLQIDLEEVAARAREVLLLSFATTLAPFVIGTGAMLALGYDGLRACVVAMTLVPTAEVVVVPILDEFGLLRASSMAGMPTD